MSASRRVGALLCVLVLIFHLAFVPLRARAFAGVLPAVGAGVVVTAFLMASGIYPYEEQKEFAEYVSSNLSSLWSQYLDWRTENSMNPPVTGNELSSLTGYLTQGVVAISRNVWNALSEFTSWIVSHFSVTDNQTNIQLGTDTLISGAASVYVSPFDAVAVMASNHRVYYSANWYSIGASVEHVFAGRSIFTDVNHRQRIAVVSYSPFQVMLAKSVSNPVLVRTYNSLSATVDGTAFYYRILTSTTETWATADNSDIPILDKPEDSVYLSDTAFAYYVLTGIEISASGVTADTTTVSALSALPSDTPWGGLAVEGIGTAATVGAVEQVIQDGVTEREKPEVKVVEVELGVGTDVDTETGAVTENPVVVTPESVIPTTAELIAPDSFVGVAVEALQTKFPFCLPFDVVRILQAFIVPPEAPVISLTFHDPFTDKDYSVTVDLSPWDEVAAACRFMWSVLLFVAFSLNVAKMFHVERGTGELFLGNVGSPGV